MRVITIAAQYPREMARPMVAIGTFDGVHRAHQAILQHVVREARQHRGTSVVVTFDPHPQHVLRPGRVPRLLTRLEQRLALFKALGIHLVWIVRFTKSFAAVSPEVFFKRLILERVQAHTVIVGRSFGFGRGRRGDSALLKQLACAAGIRARVMPDVLVGQTPVNSSRIRQAISAGELLEARRLLGRPYTLRAPVIRGSARGRRLGFPTANLDYDHLILPPNGVYVVQVRCGTRCYQGVANVGQRPTFHEQQTTVEIHLLRFRGQLYKRWLEVEWLHRLRGERAFNNIPSLQRQIASDIASAQAFFRQHKPR